tara:strand:+ start:1886 stop:2092 length:207 start_codon:yes stop_codon:yes gene_type:complete
MSNELVAQTERFNVKDVVSDLRGMMNNVTKQECNPSTVNAACNCADKITNLLKLQLEFEKFSRSGEPK